MIIKKHNFRTETGNRNETMFRKSWDVKEFIGQYAQVRLIDESSGDWGHIKLDDLKGDIICPHYLDDNNWRESKGTKDKRFSGLHLQIVTSWPSSRLDILKFFCIALALC